MRSFARSSLLPVALLAGLAACECGGEEKQPPLPVEKTQLALAVTDTSCDGSASSGVLAAARTLHFEVNGQTLLDATASTDFAVDWREAEVAGALLTVTARDEAGATLGTGFTHVDIPNAGTVQAKVWLRPVGSFWPVATEEGGCAKLADARAFHAAALLDDGRVFFVGGHDGAGADALAHRYLESAEAFNPKNATVGTAAPARAFGPEPRAYAGLVRMTGGRLLLFGGESVTGSALTATYGALVYDPLQNSWAVLDRLRVARTRFAFGSDELGRIVVFGGYSSAGAALQIEPSYEWFDPTAGIFKDGQAAVAGSARGSMEYLSGSAFVVAGGTTGTAVTSDATALKYNPQQAFMPEASAPKPLSAARQRSAHAKLGTDWLLVAGGDDGAGPETYGTPSSALDLVRYGVGTAPPVKQLAVARTDACAVALQPRAGEAAKAKVLVVGGRKADGSASGAVTLVVRRADDSVDVLEQPTGLLAARYGATCTGLKDGSVLVAGGIGAAGAALGSLELYSSGELPGP